MLIYLIIQILIHYIFLMQYQIYRRFYTLPTDCSELFQLVLLLTTCQAVAVYKYLQLIVFWHQEHLSKIYVNMLSIQIVCDHILSIMCTDSIICVPSKCISNSVFPRFVHRSTVCFHLLYIWTAAPYATSSSGGLPRNSQHFPCNKYLQQIFARNLVSLQNFHKVFEETKKFPGVALLFSSFFWWVGVAAGVAKA